MRTVRKKIKGIPISSSFGDCACQQSTVSLTYKGSARIFFFKEKYVGQASNNVIAVASIFNQIKKNELCHNRMNTICCDVQNKLAWF